MFRGSIVALVTPMSNGHVDVMRLQELVEFHVQAGTHAIVAAGTTGEAGTLSHDEKLLVIKTVAEQVQNRIPVIAGTGENSTKACIEMTRQAMNYGIDAVLIMTPAYIRPTQEGLYQHYKHIAQSTAIPIILYNVPGRTAIDLLPETVGRLADISNIVGLKEATGEMTRLQQLLRACNGKIDIYSGDDISAASWLLAGARGVISVTANVAPKLMASMCEAGLEGDSANCLRLQQQLMPLHEMMFKESNPIPAKWGVHRLGLISEEIRLPLTPLSSQYREALNQLIAAL